MGGSDAGEDLLASRILIADDDPTTVLLLERLLAGWGFRELVTTTESGQVIDLVAEACPDLVLLDLHMPAPDGLAILRQLRGGALGEAHLPVLVLTADDTQQAKERVLLGGGQDVLVKPFDHVEVRLRIRNLLETRLLHRRLSEETERAKLEIVERLALAAEYRDDETHEHAQRVAALAAAIARHIGMEPERVELLRRAAPLHDVGKIAVPDSILLKPGPLTSEEMAVVRTHTTVGARILGGSDVPVLALAEEIARSHHERWDGGGYPCGLRGCEIPLSGRIVAVADTFDALLTERPYKAPWPREVALAEIRAQAGRQFDPAIVEAFLAVVA